MNQDIAFFDFDGTITKKDTLVVFIKYAVGNFKYYKGLLLLSPILILYTLRLLSNNYAKERLLSYFFKGWSSKVFQEVADDFALFEIDKIVYKDAIKRIQWHHERGDKIVVVSASIECWIKSWCKKNNLGLIATQLSIKNSKLTGDFKGKNCFGDEKENRILELYNLDEFNEVYAYGDSKGDKALLNLADKSFYRVFKN